MSPISARTTVVSDSTIETELLSLAAARGAKTFCPSEIARRLTKNWRPLMPAIRTVADRLVTAGALRCSQGGRPVSPLAARGPIRLAQPDATS